jgi:hypothetical protein
MWPALARQTRNAQPVTIAAPQIAITGANQATGSCPTGSATRRELVCRYPFHVVVRASKTRRVNASASQVPASSAHIESSGTLDHMRMSWIAMHRTAIPAQTSARRAVIRGGNGASGNRARSRKPRSRSTLDLAVTGRTLVVASTFNPRATCVGGVSEYA